MKPFEAILEAKKAVQTGTTTVGVICKEGVILAADRQATMGYIESRYEKKVHKISDKMVLTISGLVGDLQALIRIMRAEIRLYELKNDKMSVNAAATLLANILHANRYYPYLAMLLLGGYDENGPAIYSLDPAGGRSSGEKIFATGSGSPVAMGVLESDYKNDLSIEDAKALAVKALRAARERDIYTGGSGFDIAVVTSSGLRMFEEK